MNFLKKLKGKTFSVRAQASYHREAALQKQLDALQQKIRTSELVIETAQAKIEHLTEIIMAGEQWGSSLIPESAAKVRDAKDTIAALLPPRDKLQAEIDALTKPSPA